MEAAIAASATKATYGGAGATVAGWLLSNEAAVLIGLLVGVAGFLVNWYYRHQQHKREQREHDARMSALSSGQD